MDAAAELGRNPISKHQIQPEYGDGQDDAGRDGRTHLTRPSSQARTGTGGYSFSLFSCPRAGLVTLTRLIHTLLYICDDHTFERDHPEGGKIFSGGRTPRTSLVDLLAWALAPLPAHT